MLDADKEGYLRSRTALIQTIGRAARNLDGRVILYADQMTDSMQRGDRARPSAGARSNRSTMPPTASRRKASGAASPTSSTASTSSDHVTVALGESEQAHYQGSNLKAVIADLEKRCAPPPPISNSRKRRGCATRSSGSRRYDLGLGGALSAAGAVQTAQSPRGRSIGGRAGTSGKEIARGKRSSAAKQAQAKGSAASGRSRGPTWRGFPAIRTASTKSAAPCSAGHRRRASASAAPSPSPSPMAGYDIAVHYGQLAPAMPRRSSAAIAAKGRRAVALAADLTRESATLALAARRRPRRSGR